MIITLKKPLTAEDKARREAEWKAAEAFNKKVEELGQLKGYGLQKAYAEVERYTADKGLTKEAAVEELIVLTKDPSKDATPDKPEVIVKKAILAKLEGMGRVWEVPGKARLYLDVDKALAAIGAKREDYSNNKWWKLVQSVEGSYIDLYGASVHSNNDDILNYFCELI